METSVAGYGLVVDPAAPEHPRRRSGASARRTLAWGAIGGIVVGLLSLPLVGVPHGETAWLVRLTMLLPAVVYVAWWAIGPGIRRSDAEQGTGVETSQAGTDRAARVAEVFDSAAVPRARRSKPESAANASSRQALRASIRRDDVETPDRAAFGFSRPRPRDLDVDAH